jgi:hypothetical protein
MELTTARGMLAMECCQPVYDITCQAYAGADPNWNAKVKEVVDWWLELAGILYEMGKLMKSQKKMTEDRIQMLEVLIVKYAVLWRKKITYKNPVFWKMHIMECCFINFVRVTGMSGRASAEGMENKHFHMGKLKAMMAPVVKTDVRVAKLSQRQQIYLLPGLAKKFEKIESRTKRTGRRGPYKNKGLVTRNTEEVIELLDEDDDDDDVPEGHFEVANEGILPNEFAELYNFYKTRLMPEHWRKPFESDECLAAKQSLEPLTSRLNVILTAS